MIRKRRSQRDKKPTLCHRLKLNDQTAMDTVNKTRYCDVVNTFLLRAGKRMGPVIFHGSQSAERRSLTSPSNLEQEK